MGFILYRLIQAAMWLLTPIVLVVTWLSRGFLRLLGLEPAPIHDRLSEDEFRSILNVGAEEGAIAQTKRKMLSSIFDIAKKSVKEVMIPRTMMIMIEESTPPGKVFEIFVHSGFSRIPVFSGHAENVVGTIHAKDLLGLLQRGEEADIGRLLRKPFFIPASAPVETALSEFQKAKVHMGIVVDEYGGLEGIVTIEDLIEEIVGEIQDEHDEESDYLRPQPDGSCLIDGGAAIDKINERLSLGIPEEPGFMTIAGFILSKLGRIPKETEAIEFNGRQFIVEKVTRRTISLIRLVPVASPPCTQLKKNGMPTNEGDH